MIQRTSLFSGAVRLFATGVYLASISFSLIAAQVAHATDLPVTNVSGLMTSDQTWTDGNVYMVGYLEVPEDTTLTIDAGAVVKVAGSITIDAGATLLVEGTPGSPVTFTSYKDDSIGGDSNGDGSSSGAQGDFVSAIIANGGSIDIKHAIIQYGSYAILNSCSGPSTNVVSVTDSSIYSGIVVEGCAFGTLSLQRNAFNVGSGFAISAWNLDITNITLSGSDKNTFTGSGQHKVVSIYNTSIPSGATWSVAGSSGAVIRVRQLTVDGTLNLEQGAIVKVPESATGIYLDSGGVLNANGTSGFPVTITSLNDDSVGGDSGGDGATSGSSSDADVPIVTADSAIDLVHTNFSYTGTSIYSDSDTGGTIALSDSSFSHVATAIIMTSAHADLQNISIDNAIDGINLLGGAKVILRGSLTNISDKAIKACNWSGSCSVDAAYVNWGTSDGPFTTDPANNKVCGRVTVGPWVDQSAPSGIFNVLNCNGSDSYDVQLASSISGFQSRVDYKQTQCDNGFEDFCDAANQAYSCLSGAVDAAASTAPFALPSASTATQVSAFDTSVLGAAANYIADQEELSPSQFSFAIAGNIASLTGTFESLISAYNSCG